MSKKDIKVSAEAREIAKNNLEQAQQTYAAFSQAAERMVETTRKGLPETAKEFHDRLSFICLITISMKSFRSSS